VSRKRIGISLVNLPPVLVLGHSSNRIPQSVCEGFERIGARATLVRFGVPSPRWRAARLAARYLDPDNQRADACSFNEALRSIVVPQLRRDRQAILVVMRGYRVDTKVARAIHALPNPVVLWTYDSLARWPAQASLSAIAHHRFYIDRVDVPPGDAAATWLPLGYDDAIYRPVGKKDLDVVFVGTVRSLYQRRRRFLERLAGSSLAKNFRCGFVGSTGLRIKDRFLRIGKHLSWIATHLSETELAQVVASARISINVHQDDGGEPVNPMFFAMPGAGACMLAYGQPHLARWLQPDVEYVPFGDTDYLQRIEALLGDEARLQAIRERGLRAVQMNHTYAARAKTILDRLDSENFKNAPSRG
jgi:hypothetical protein